MSVEKKTSQYLSCIFFFFKDTNCFWRTCWKTPLQITMTMRNLKVLTCTLYDELLYLKHFIQNFSGNTLHFCDEKIMWRAGRQTFFESALYFDTKLSKFNFNFLRGELIKLKDIIFFRIHVNFNYLVVVTLKTWIGNCTERHLSYNERKSLLLKQYFLKHE